MPDDDYKVGNKQTLHQKICCVKAVKMEQIWKKIKDGVDQSLLGCGTHSTRTFTGCRRSNWNARMVYTMPWGIQPMNKSGSSPFHGWLMDFFQHRCCIARDRWADGVFELKRSCTNRMCTLEKALKRTMHTSPWHGTFRNICISEW